MPIRFANCLMTMLLAGLIPFNLPVAASADETDKLNELSQAERDAGFVAMFNGK